MQLGQAIAQIRKERGLTQETFAKMFNVTRQTVSNWENEKSYPDLSTLVKISDEFNVSLDVLLKEDFRMVKVISSGVSGKFFSDHSETSSGCTSAKLLFIAKPQPPCA